MAEAYRGRKAPWAAFAIVALLALFASAAWMIYRNAPAPQEAMSLDLGPPVAPSLPPISPVPNPSPTPLPTPG